MENLPKTKKLILTSNFLLILLVDGGGIINYNDNDRKFQSYKKTNSGYDMLFESVKSDQ